MSTYRLPPNQPFAANSVWNIGIGSGVTWSVDSDADATQLHGVGGNVTTDSFGQPIYFGVGTDPFVAITCTDNLFPVPVQHLHVPIGATPAGGSDMHMNFYDATQPLLCWSYFDCTFNNGTNVSGGITAALGAVWPVYGDGITNVVSAGTDYNYLAGVITDYDVSIGAINHAIRCSISRDALHSPGAAWDVNIPWPNKHEDFDGPSTYTGAITAGCTLGIPASVNLGSLGLNAGGLMLATCLQKYGAIWRDSGGNNAISFYSTPHQVSNSLVLGMISNMATIVSKMQVMRNQASNNVNGGGSYANTAAPLNPRPSVMAMVCT